MSGTRTRTFVFAATLMLMMFGAVTGAFAKDTAPSENPVINYPAFPLRGGIYIVDATYNPNPTVGDPRIVLVFNEGVVAASLGDPWEDFVSETMTLDQGAPLWSYGDNDGDNVLHLIIPADGGGFTAGTAETIQMLPGAIRGVRSMLPNTDVSRITIGEGPVITSVVLRGWEDDLQAGGAPPDATTPNNNTVIVTFNDDVELVDDADAAFGETIEFNGADLDAAIVGPTITLSWDDTTDNFLYMQPGVMNLHLASGEVAYDGGGDDNNRDVYRETENDGPLFLSMYYNTNGTADSTDDVIAAVFDQDLVVPDTPFSYFTTFFSLDNNDPNFWYIGSGDGVVETWFSTNFTQILRIRNFTSQALTSSPPDPDMGLVNLVSAPGFELTDYQGLPATADGDIDIHVGPGIVRSAYNDNKQLTGPNDPSDDRLYVYLSEPINVLQADSIETRLDYFTLDGFTFGPNTTVEYRPPAGPDQFALVIYTDFTDATDPYEQGDRIIPTEPTGDMEVLVGDLSGEPLWADDCDWTPVHDESRPAQVALSDIHDPDLDQWIPEYFNGVVDPDTLYTIFLRFRESSDNGISNGLEDGDEYFLYTVLREDTEAWDKDNMATYLEGAIPIGNLRPRQIDLNTRLTLQISPNVDFADSMNATGEFNIISFTADGEPILHPGDLAFLLASSDWQGNLARIETINPDEFAWTWLYPEPFVPPPADCRIFIQEEYCTPPVAEEGWIGLYGLHYIHDCDPDRARFEYLKEVVENECDTDAGEVWETLATVGGVNADSARGDKLIYRWNSDEGCHDDLAMLQGEFGGRDFEFLYTGPGPLGDGRYYWYYNADNDEIEGFPVYSSRDAVILSANNVYNSSVDDLIIGSDDWSEGIPEGVPLTPFTNYSTDEPMNPAYYWAEAATACDGSGTSFVLDPTDYIFRENRNGYTGGDLPVDLQGVNLWRYDWWPCDRGEEPDPDWPFGDGDYLTRIVAITATGEEDTLQQHCYDPDGENHWWNPQEIQPVKVTCVDIGIDLTEVDVWIPNYNTTTDEWEYLFETLDLGAVPDPDTIPKNTKFIRIHAEPTDPDVNGVLFSIAFQDGSPDTMTIGWNPDGDTYAELNALPGYQHDDDVVDVGPGSPFYNQKSYAPYLDDERIIDDGDFIYEPGIDEVVDMGRNDVIDTPEGHLLIPLVNEDINYMGVVGDYDDDGNTLDDGSVANMTDENEPFSAWYDLSGYTVTDWEDAILFADVTRSAPECPSGIVVDADTDTIRFENWTPPIMTGPVRVENLQDEPIDVWHPVSDGDPYAILPLEIGDARQFLLHITAEDILDGIEWVRIFYRTNPACGGTPTGWKLATTMITTPDGTPWDEYPDMTYPYEFHWQLGTMDDTNAYYQFYAEAMDGDGTYSWPPVYPYGFGFHEYAGEDLAFVTTPIGNDEPTCEDGPVVAIGDEFLIEAELDDPALEGDVIVRFYFAPRIQGEDYLGEDVDPVTLMLELDETILDPENGGLVVCVDDVPLIPDVDYVAYAGDSYITFLVAPEEEAAITVNYNFINGSSPPSGWLGIGDGDNTAPYTVEWEEGGPDPAGVPPQDDPAGDGSVDWSAANAYDLIAIGHLDVDGDGVYDEYSICDILEPFSSENGNHIILELVSRPIVHLFGLDYEPVLGDPSDPNNWHYPQQFWYGGVELRDHAVWPGNPFGVSLAGNEEYKLSGLEADVWAVAYVEQTPAVIETVELELYKEFHSEPYQTVPMDLIENGDEFDIVITMYSMDYYEVRPEEIENVILWLAPLHIGGDLLTYEMTDSRAGHYQATATIEAGVDYIYGFFIDKIGDDFLMGEYSGGLWDGAPYPIFGSFVDRRNHGMTSDIIADVVAGPPPQEGVKVSMIATPDMDFYATTLEPADRGGELFEDTIYRAKVIATDSEGHVGTNMSDGSKMPQGPIVFVYDTTPPTIDDFWADPQVVPGAGPMPETTLWLDATDLPNDDVNVITTRTVVFQISMTDPADEWITVGIDRDHTDGWSADLEWTAIIAPNGIPRPDDDNYDNDGDGEIDEMDEAVFGYPARAVVFDDGGYGGYPWATDFPGSGNPTYSDIITIYYDGLAPYTHILDPHDGNVFAHGSTIPVVGLASDDTPPEAIVEPGVHHVRFQYKDGHTMWIDTWPSNGGSKAIQPGGGNGYYNHGLDFVFIDDGTEPGEFDPNDTILNLGGYEPNYMTPGDPWFDIDPTPMDSADDPIIHDPDGGAMPEDTQYSIDFYTTQVWSTEDVYVHLRMLAEDTAGNETPRDPFHAEEIVIILDDMTAPTAFLQWASEPCPDEPMRDYGCRTLSAGETEAFKDDITLFGQVVDATDPDLARVAAVDVEISTDGLVWDNLGRVTEFDADPADFCDMDLPEGKYFSLMWLIHTEWWAEGIYYLRVVAIDDDGNSNPDGALVIMIEVDRTPPTVMYGGNGVAFVRGLGEYSDDGTDGTSLVVVRDSDTGDVEFRVYTMDDDIKRMTLQWRYLSDPIGLWRHWSEAFNEWHDSGRLLFSDFQYEPAHNYGDYYAWVAHAEDWYYESVNDPMADIGDEDYLFQYDFIEGPVVWRVLATDAACNTNGTQGDVVEAAVDLTPPWCYDYSTDKPTSKVVPGEEITFTVVLKDEVTDVRHVTIIAEEPDGTRHVAGDGELLPVVEGDNVFDLDGPNTQWLFTATWAYPTTVYMDTPLDIYIVGTDAAGNRGEEMKETITVEDLVPPDNTKIVLIAGEVMMSDDPYDGWEWPRERIEDPFDPTQWEFNDNVWVNRDGVNGYQPYGGDEDNDDYLISEGAREGVEGGEPLATWFTEVYGDPLATYPRWVDEGYMGNPAANPPRLARDVTLVARTWVDDQSFGEADDGVAKVTFWVRPVGGAPVPVGEVVLGKDEYQPFYPLYLWHIYWNTKAVDTDGVTPLWPDGLYDVTAQGEDLSGNVEDAENLEWTRVQVDNTAPLARMDADPTTEEYESDAGEIERNTMFTLFARILPEGPLHDDTAAFYMKRTRDLNMEGSWLMVPPFWGIDPNIEDGNPDNTRPYSFDLDLGKCMDPVDYLHWLNDPNAPIPGPLHVGEEYDFVAAASDLVGNTTSHIDTYADSRDVNWVKLKVVDTIAPTMTITQVQRNIGDTQTIRNPDRVWAQSFDYLWARNLDGHVDLDDCFFVYREEGTTAWTLLDGDVSTNSHPFEYFEIGPWDLRTLKHNTWYEVAAIGVDDVGNMANADDPDYPKIYVFVDFEAPDNYVIVMPGEDTGNLCDWYGDGYDHRFYDLAVTDTDAVENEDTWLTLWFYKKSRYIDDEFVCDYWDWLWDNAKNDHDCNWNWINHWDCDTSVLHDDATNTWSLTWDLVNPDCNDPNDAMAMVDGLDSDMYDIAVVIMDQSGNYTLLKKENLVYDRRAPDPVAITNIEALTGGDIDFHPGGNTDLAPSVEVRIWASAKDDEYDEFPDIVGTDVTLMQFEVSFDNMTWIDLGTTVPVSDMNDPKDFAGYVDWNTTGLSDGQTLYLRVTAWDECGNWARGYHTIIITDIVPPIARIVCFDPDLQLHGPPKTYVDIYALAESDDCLGDEYDGKPEDDAVQIQYDTIEGPEDVDHEWVNVGIAEGICPNYHEYSTEVLYRATVETSAFPEGVNRFWLRALVKDCDGNRLGDDPDDVVPMMEAYLDTLPDGSITFRTVRTDPPVVESVSVEIESATPRTTQAILTVKMANAVERPRVTVLGETNYNIFPSDYAWIYHAGIPSDPEHGDFGMVRSLDDPTVWRGKITLVVDYCTEEDILECLNFTVCVTGLDDSWFVDRTGVYVHEYPVSIELGTNGTVMTPGYEYADTNAIYNTVEVLSGAWQVGDEACLLVSETIAPQLDSHQGMFLAPVDYSAWHMVMTKTESDKDFATGYLPVVTLKYSEAVVAELLEGMEGVDETMLTVRRWNPWHDAGYWDGTGISAITVDPEANTISFRVDNLTKAAQFGSEPSNSHGNIFQIFAPKSSAPVFVQNVLPHSEYLSDWWTDPDPLFTVYLNDVGGQGVDPHSVKVKIDGREVATFMGWNCAWSSPNDPNTPAGGNDYLSCDADWVWGDGYARLFAANDDGLPWEGVSPTRYHSTVYELVYSHSIMQRDWLEELTDMEGNPVPHILTVEYKTVTGTDIVSVDTPFYVDFTAPMIEFHGGWVANPLLRNVAGYVPGDICNEGPLECMLTVKLTDEGSGMFIRPQRQEFLVDYGCDWNDPDWDDDYDDWEDWYEFYNDCTDILFDPVFGGGSFMYDWYWQDDDACLIPYDWGFKYDLWLVHPENDQGDIDEYEERLLLHTGTADEILPYIQRMPLDGEGQIVDGLAGYNPLTEALLARLPIVGGGLIQDGDVLEVVIYSAKCVGEDDGNAWGCDVGLDLDLGDGEEVAVAADCWFDSDSQERHFYEKGVMDQARNSGSRYVEQRFVVDMMPPVCTFNLPGATVDPSGDMLIDVSLVDTGSGLATGSAKITVKGPDGEELDVTDETVSGDRITAKLEGPLEAGDYVITVEGADKLGHECVTTKTVRVEAAILTLTEAYGYPNPFNPAGGDMTIHFSVSKTSDVTIKVYDFAGEYVTTVVSNERMDPSSPAIMWGGTASDGTELANGAYIVRVVASDGARTEKANLKVVIWRD